MPRIRSSIKRMRQSARRRNANRSRRSAMRTAIKKLRSAIAQGDAATATALLPTTVGVISRCAQKRVIHHNNASRNISRLSRQVGEIGQSGEAPS